MPEDAFGRMVRDEFQDELRDRPVYRWEGGLVEEAEPGEYFRPPETWAEWTRDRLATIDGPVIDLGCAAGRHSLYLQGEGHAVVATDRSPGALEVAAQRGVERPVLTDLRRLGLRGIGAGGVVGIGYQLGVGGTVRSLRDTLDHLAALTAPGGRLVGDLPLPSSSRPSERVGEQPGDGVAERLRVRVEYAGCVGPWVDLLAVARPGLRSILEPTAWSLVEVADEGPREFKFVLRRDSSAPRGP